MLRGKNLSSLIDACWTFFFVFISWLLMNIISHIIAFRNLKTVQEMNFLRAELAAALQLQLDARQKWLTWIWEGGLRIFDSSLEQVYTCIFSTMLLACSRVQVDKKWSLNDGLRNLFFLLGWRAQSWCLRMHLHLMHHDLPLDAQFILKTCHL